MAIGNMALREIPSLLRTFLADWTMFKATHACNVSFFHESIYILIGCTTRSNLRFLQQRVSFSGTHTVPNGTSFDPSLTQSDPSQFDPYIGMDVVVVGVSLSVVLEGVTISATFLLHGWVYLSSATRFRWSDPWNVWWGIESMRLKSLWLGSCRMRETCSSLLEYQM